MDNKSYFDNINHIHFIGIGGVSMSGLAKLCLHWGINVSGSDKTKSNLTEELEHLGAKIYHSHKKSNIKNVDLVVYTVAINENNPELVFAKQNYNTMERSEFCGLITTLYKNVIAIGGTHGKTTTTGMIASIFVQGQKEPTVMIGGESLNFLGTLLCGKNDFLILEACEYKEHFLNFEYDVAVITNIEYDHPDYYKNEQQLIKAFEKFANKSKKMCIIGEQYKSLIDCKQDLITIGDNGNYTTKHISHLKTKTKFDVYKNGDYFGSFVIRQHGNHNVQDAVCAIAVADYYGIDKKIIFDGLLNFASVKRRQEYLGKIGSNLVFTDYAHHPTEISACVNAFKLSYDKKIVVFFQPHTYSRTKFLMTNFIQSLSIVDDLFILPTYPAREKPIKNSSGKQLYKNLLFLNKKVRYIYSPKSIKKAIMNYSNSIIIFMGAGDIINIANEVLKIQKQK